MTLVPPTPLPPRQRPCPVCGRPLSVEHTPFCSRRCADRDLHRWMAGVYAIASEGDENSGLEAETPDAG